MNRPYVNEFYEVDILNYTAEGNGVCRVFSYPVFVPFSCIGDKLTIKITKDKKSYFEGEIIEILEKSNDRVMPNCQHFGKCGGCDLLHINYQKQLDMKRETVKNAVNRIAKETDILIDEVIGMDNPVFYRNKVIFNFDKIDNKITLGFLQKKSYNVVAMELCEIIHNKINETALLVQSFCNQFNFLPKKLAVKYSFSTNEVMVCLIIDNKAFKLKNELIEILTQLPEIKSIIINYADKKTINFGEKSEVIYGKDFITETLDGLKFKKKKKKKKAACWQETLSVHN